MDHARADDSLRQLGDFEIVRELGRGGMGVVYEARQRSLSRRVALKVLSSGLGLTTKAIMRFKREAEAAGRLHHTNIVPIYTTGDENRIPYYAMEFIDGPSLDQVIRDMRCQPTVKTKGALDSTDDVSVEHGRALPSWVAETIGFVPPSTGIQKTNSSQSPISRSSSLGLGATYYDNVARMTAEVAEALAHAHDQGVIHRDIKPSNLLLSPEGSLSITDFGLARILEQPGMTISGELMGSPMYMSPEQITAGRIPLDHRTDIYSLGATLYEMLTLRPPFPGATRDQILSQIIHKDVVPPRKINSTIPRDLETVCLKAMDKDPDRRYPLAGGLAEDLRRYLDRHSILARRVGPIEKSIRYLRRNPFAAAFLGLLLVLIVVLSYVGWAAHDRQRAQEVKEIQSDFLIAVLQADYDGAHDLVRQAERLKAPTSWVESSRGQISLTQGEYESARASFERVLQDDPNDIAAKSLRALALLWGGDEVSYFEELADIHVASADEFRELVLLGYANTWNDPKESLRLLNQAEQIKPRHLMVRVFRAQAGRLHAMQLIDRTEAREHIDQALTDCQDTMRLLEDTPLVFSEYTLANLAAANIYATLADQASAEKQDFLNRAAELREAAAAARVHLERFPDNADVQYALCCLIQQIGDDQAVLDLAAQWDRDAITVDTFPAQMLGLALFRIREYDQAVHWLSMARGRQAANTRFLEFYVRLADPARRMSREELRREFKAHVDDKLARGGASYYSFDAMLLQLLGDEDARRYFGKDYSMTSLIRGGEVHGPLLEYFSERPSPTITAPDELIAACNTSPAPIPSRMAAHFSLGIESLSQRDVEGAADYFQKCLDDGFFPFYVYLLSEAMLAHQTEWSDWVSDDAIDAHSASPR